MSSIVPHVVHGGMALEIVYYRCRSTAGGRRPCGHQVSAPAIEAALLQNVEALWGLDTKAIPDHVESVVYDHRDQRIRVKMIPLPDAEGESDSAELQVPTETGKH
jgi:hypothetical protein